MTIGRQERFIADMMAEREVNHVLQARGSELEQLRAEDLPKLNLSGKSYAAMAVTFAEIYNIGGQDAFSTMQCYFGARACEDLANQKGYNFSLASLGIYLGGQA